MIEIVDSADIDQRVFALPREVLEQIRFLLTKKWSVVEFTNTNKRKHEMSKSAEVIVVGLVDKTNEGLNVNGL